MLYFLSPSTGLTDIFLVYIHDLYPLHEIYKNKNAMLFNIRTWKAHNFAENQTNLTEKLKKIGSGELLEPTFCKCTCLNPELTLYDRKTLCMGQIMSYLQYLLSSQGRFPLLFKYHLGELNIF